jgi:hypothetical protein
MYELWCVPRTRSRLLSRKVDLRVTCRPDFVECGPIYFPRPHSQEALVHESYSAALSAYFLYYL